MYNRICYSITEKRARNGTQNGRLGGLFWGRFGAFWGVSAGSEKRVRKDPQNGGSAEAKNNGFPLVLQLQLFWEIPGQGRKAPLLRRVSTVCGGDHVMNSMCMSTSKRNSDKTSLALSYHVIQYVHGSCTHYSPDTASPTHGFPRRIRSQARKCR